MSTAPQGWQNPKTNWQAADAPLPADFNRIESNINAIETGSRTVDPAQAPTGNAGTLRQLLDWFSNRLAAIIGGNWWNAPAATLATIWGKFNGSSGHKHTGGANDAPPIPLSGIDSAAKTSAGGSEANRLAVTDANGAVGRANALRDGGGTYRTATSPGGTTANAVAVTDGSGRVGRAITADQLNGVAAASYARLDQPNTWSQKQTFQVGPQIGDGNQDISDLYALLMPLDTRSIVVTQWDTTYTSEPAQIQIKDGVTVVATIDVLARNSRGKPTQIRVTQGSRTITWNATWTSGRSWPDSVTKTIA